jgi:hypothetical protein
MKKTFLIFLFVTFTFIILSSCGKKLTVCECMNSSDQDYRERCREWFKSAPHDEYVQMMREKENCK